MSKRFELVFAGAALVSRFPRYVRWHNEYETAANEAKRINGLMEGGIYGLSRAAHTPIIYGPGCGRDGTVPASK